MYISKVHIKNFRLLQDTEMLIDENQKDLSILLGRNNSGKTSFVSIFEKFLLNPNFNFYDFPLALRQKLMEFNEETDVNDLLIQLVITIQYFQEDSFEYISNFFMDLSTEVSEINILCECSIKKEQFLKSISEISEDGDIKQKYIENNLDKYLDVNFYSFLDKEDLNPQNRHKLVKRERRHLEQLINIQVVHAKRDVASSESSSSASGALSKLANIYFDKEYGHQENDYAEINKEIFKMDDSLNVLYDKHFKNFLSMAKEFLSLSNLQVKSNLESKRLFASASKITYGDTSLSLPENLNGLGHLNILYLLIQMELIKAEFLKNSKDINLLFIEEPEAHTHPQMQYVFAKHIKKVLKEIKKSQTFITTHSSHILTQCDFKDIKYFKSSDKNVKIQNFYNELKNKYSSEPDHFKFLKQYLTLYSAELFFAEKVIFIEGTSEVMLLPYFIQEVGKEISEPKISLSSQNITIIEAGANAKVFSHFLEFLDIKTLIITDIDTISGESRKACQVNTTAGDTSNQTIKYYLEAPKPKEKPATLEDKERIKNWLQNEVILNKSLSDSNIKVCYQVKTILDHGGERFYHARSFEDAFISENFEQIKINKDDIQGLKLRKKLDEFNINDGCFYTLTNEILYSDGKSDFAASILYLALTKGVKWQVPLYIKEGLKWIAE